MDLKFYSLPSYHFSPLAISFHKQQQKKDTCTQLQGPHCTKGMFENTGFNFLSLQHHYNINTYQITIDAYIKNKNKT